ncbi:MAG TPA: hypothetical protein VHD87_16110 [Acidimicrobiales bacterium]|nr:hypothetical protein [Acidimicrobiales bacterium]
MTTQRRFIALVTSLLLTFAGVLALTLAPTRAQADALPPHTPDFTVNPGDTKTQSFSKTLVGNGGAVTNTPSACRTDPVESLTCDARRIHVNRAAGYTLRIVLEWTAAAGSINSVPDVDMYVFTGPNSSLDNGQVGGAGSTMPEQAKFVPTQDEYDVVVQAFAGAITGYKLTVYYENGGSKISNVTPDIVLSPNQAPFVKTYSTALAGENGEPALYPVVHQHPDDCRNNPAYNGLCDVYRLKLNRSTAKGAQNFVVLQLDWDGTMLPDLALVAAGLGLGYVPDLNIYVWDTPSHELGYQAIGGNDSSEPERAAFTATQDEYDVVIQCDLGASTSYKLTAYMTDELFSKPFEVLDPLTGQPVGSAPLDDSNNLAGLIPDHSGDTIGTLPLAPVDTDTQIAGIGLGTTQEFNPEGVQFGHSALRNTAATGPAPSGFVLVLALVLFPLLVLAAGFWALRRRHEALI